MKWITTVIVVATTVLVSKWMSVAVEKPQAEIRHRVDTVRVERTTHDTVTVISRAADTIRIVMRDGGPLTQKDLVRLICNEAWLRAGGGDEFMFNAYGMVFCPAKEDK